MDGKSNIATYFFMKKKEYTMFKKTLMAAAFATLAMNVNATPTLQGETTVAGEITPLLVTYSTEGAQTAAAISTGQLEVVMGVEYKVNDTITLSFSADLAEPNNLDGLVGSLTNDLTNSSGTKIGEITLGLLENTANSITFRVTSIQSEDNLTNVSTRDQVLSFPAIPLVGSEVRDENGATVSYQAKAFENSVFLDGTVTPTEADVIAFASQFEAAIEEGFSRVIDVERQLAGNDTFVTTGMMPSNDDTRLYFEMSHDDITATASFSATDTSVETDSDGEGSYEDPDNVNTDAVFTSYTVSLSGDFSDVVATQFVATGAEGDYVTGGAPSITGNVLTYTWDTAEETTLTFTADEATQIDTQMFTATVDVNYTDAGEDHDNSLDDDAADYTDEYAAGDAGEFTMNGVEITVYAMPYNPNRAISQFVWVTNDGASDAVVSATATFNNGVTVNLGEVGVAAAGSLTSMANIKNLLQGATGAPESGRATITFTITGDRADINLSAGYVVDGDRLQLETSQTLNEGVFQPNNVDPTM
jgi:hypothetical protein